MAVENGNELLNVVTLLGAAMLVVPLFKKIGLGSVLGYLSAGLIIGPFGLKLFTDAHQIIHIAELGVVMFLFIIGLEMKPSHLWNLRRQIFGLGSLQVIACTVLLTLAGLAIGFRWEVAFVAASGFVLTSTAIVMQVLGERGDISSTRGQRIVSILLFEDLIIVPLLAFVTFIAPEHQTEGSEPIWLKLGQSGLSVILLVVIGIWILNPLFKALSRTKLREMMTIGALFVVLGSALLMELGGLSTAMGAFLAGVLLSESSFRHQLEADIDPFRGLLLGLFFLGVGMSLDLNVVGKNWIFILSTVIIAMILKSICIYVVARITKSNHLDAMDRSVLMAQGGEFAFVLYTAATGLGIFDAETNANVTAIVVLSMVFTPFSIIIHNKVLLPFFIKRNFIQAQPDEITEKHPIILIGIGRFGQVINHLLSMSGYHATVIDLDSRMVEGLKKYGYQCYYGDATRPELLHAAGIENAEILVIAINNVEQTTHIAKVARAMNPNLKIIARSYDRLHGFELYRAGVDKGIRETFDSAVRAAKWVLRYLGIEKSIANEVGHIYFKRDSELVRLMSEVYDPKIDVFKNTTMMKLALEEDQDTKMEIQKVLAQSGQQVEE